MKLIIKIIIIFLISITLNAREIGETEITTEDGIEVFQNEKFYLLKQNVKIVSDNLILNADEVKINFDKIINQFPDFKYITILSPGRGAITFHSYEIDFDAFNWFSPDENGEYTIIVKDKNGRHKLKYRVN